jgi:hypothetical protein
MGWRIMNSGMQKTQFSMAPKLYDAPKPAPTKQAIESQPRPVKSVRAIQMAHDKYTVVEDTYESPPSTTKTLLSGVSRIVAEDEVRLWNENMLGFQRFGQSGLTE